MEEIKPERIKSKEKIKIDRFLCGICQNVLISPRKCSKCPKHFCDLCSSAYLETNSSCPSCKQIFSMKDAEHYLIEDLKEIPIECKNNPFGCKEIICYSNIFEHEESCSYNIKNNDEKIKTSAFVDTYVSNNFTLIEKKLNKISNELKEMKESNSNSLFMLERKIDSLHEMLYNYLSNKRKGDLCLKENEVDRNIIFKGKVTENNSLNKPSNRYYNDSTLQPNINSNQKLNIDNNPIERNNISPSKSPIRTVDVEQTGINSNRKTNLNNNPTKDKKDLQQSSQVDIKDKCLYLYYCKGKKRGCKSSGDVWGNNPYTCDTDLCRAGIHSGQINENGGLYIVGYGGPFNNFPSSQKNGIMSNTWEESQDTHFIVANISSYPIDTSRMSYDKCGLYIGVCLGKPNGCCQTGVVFGSNPYSHESNLCNSALHSGVINNNGGIFAIHSGGQVNRFPASTNNGVTSEKNGFDSISFLIKPFK